MYGCWIRSRQEVMVSRPGSLWRKGVCLSWCCRFPQLCIIRWLACFKPWSCIKTPARLVSDGGRPEQPARSHQRAPPIHLFLEEECALHMYVRWIHVNCTMSRPGNDAKRFPPAVDLQSFLFGGNSLLEELKIPKPSYYTLCPAADLPGTENNTTVVRR